ncbi:MAG: energy transducer TonB [Gammaproteobacteria bacterium]
MSAKPAKPLTTPAITPTDRFGMTLFLAIVVHAVAVLGVTFQAEDKPEPNYDTMEVILVQQQSKPPEDADYLAQANLEGGGDSEEKLSPQTPLPAPFPDPNPEVAAPPPADPAPPPTPVAEAEVAEETPAPEPLPEPELLAAETSEPAELTAVEETEPTEDPPADPEPEPQETTAEAEPAAEPVAATEPTPPRPTPSAAALISSSQKIAALNAEIRRKMQAQAERPRRKFISASTQEYKYASYMEAWRAKVERVGNLNYPEEARKRGLTGSLILDVALRPDGAVDQITVRRSSGNKILDDAAIRIVELSAPFAPLPDNIRAETDILHITRTWQFLNNERFR